MEIARLEVSTQQHLERMQETAKVNYIQYGKIHQGQEGEETTVWCRGEWPQCRGRWPQGLQAQLKRQQKTSTTTRHLLQMWERKTPKGTGLQSCGCNMQRMWKERTLREGLPQGENAPHTLLKLHILPPALQGQGLLNPFTSVMRDNQCTLIWSVSPM